MGCPNEELHVGDTPRLNFTIKKNDGTCGSLVAFDISGATTRSVLMKKPDGKVLTRAGTLLTDGTDGKMYYDVLAADLNEAGKWHFRAEVTGPGYHYESSTVEEIVHSRWTV